MSDQRPQIIFLANGLNGGGAERSLLEIFHAVDRQRFNPVLWRLGPLNMYPEYLTPADSTEVLPKLPKDPETTARVKHIGAMLPPHLLKAEVHELVADALRIFDRLQPVVRAAASPVILVSSQSSMNIRAAILQWLCAHRVPVVYIEQNEPYVRYLIGESNKARTLHWTRIRETYPQATCVVAVSRAVKASLQDRFGIAPQRIAVIPNPVNLEKLRTARSTPRPPHPFYHANSPVVICVARFSPQKNHQMLLRSLALARKELPLKLILLGHGELKDAIQRSIREMGLDEAVALVDFHPEPFSLIAHADVLALASYCEGHPLALLEALACGVPVVSTNWAGAREIIDDGANGVICDMNDHALAAGLLAGLHLAKSSATSAVAQASVERFAVSTIARKYESLFEKIIREDTPGPSFTEAPTPCCRSRFWPYITTSPIRSLRNWPACPTISARNGAGARELIRTSFAPCWIIPVIPRRPAFTGSWSRWAKWSGSWRFWILAAWSRTMPCILRGWGPRLPSTTRLKRRISPFFDSPWKSSGRKRSRFLPIMAP